jgi:quinol-cytochrome oxidoreductase complex cytochrome b subunit
MVHDALVVGGQRVAARHGEIDERPWVVATKVALAVVGVIALMLVITGIMLVFGYQPDVTVAYAKAQGIPSHSHVRTVHGAASRLLFPAFGCLAIAAGGLALVRHRLLRLVPVVVAGLAVLAATFTGYLLPWDQIAFTRVSVGTNEAGYRMILFNNHVKYVLLGNNEVGTGTVARWFWVHVVGTTVLLIVPVLVIAQHTRATNRGRSNDAGTTYE